MPGEGIVGIMRRRPNGAAKPLWLWGDNWYGPIGDGTNIIRSSPVQTIAFGNNWAKVSVNRSVAAIKTDGTLWTWGNNGYAQLGNNTVGLFNSVSSPIQTVAGGNTWSDVAAGVFHNLAVKTDGTLWGWGYGKFGSLKEDLQNYSSPVQIGTSTTWSTVAAGMFSAGLKKDGTLWVWGFLTSGVGGNNIVTPASSPVQVGTQNNWASISGSDWNIGGVKTDGTLWNWGWNAGFDYSSGNLGDNTVLHRSSPVQTITGGTTWTSISCGREHTGGIKNDGSLWMWGRNVFGELGDNTRVAKSSPIQTITYGNNWKLVSCGSYKTLAIKTDTTLWSWGCNYDGSLGINDTSSNKSSPIQVAGFPTNWSFAVAGGAASAAIQGSDLPPVAPTPFSPPSPIPLPTQNGYMWNWGNNTNGGLGDNSITHRSSAVQVTGNLSNWKQVNGGDNHAVAIKTDGTLWTFGLNDNGQLGDNTLAKKSSPVQTIALGTNWSQVSAGYRHTIGVKSDGTLWTWGLNTEGQLGDNSVTHRSSPVQTLGFATTWASSSSGKSHSSAIKSDGTLWCWGLNTDGQIGDNTVTKKSSPIQTTAFGTNWKYVSCGQNHTAAVKFDGTIWSWGKNDYGQLGDNSTTHRSSPIQTVSFGTNWAVVSCGSSSTYAIKTDGTLWAWGASTYGQLGNGTLSHRSSPVQITYASEQWVAISGGYNHAIGKTTSGSSWTWGRNNYGQGDNNDTVNYSQPRAINLANFDWVDVFAGSSSNSTYTLAFTTLTPPPSPPPTPTPVAPPTAPTTPTAPSPAPPTPASPFAFASVDEHLYKFYVIRLKNEKATVVCLESSPDVQALAGPFDTFAEAKEAEIKFNS